jgi:hypothetical protein
MISFLYVPALAMESILHDYRSDRDFSVLSPEAIPTYLAPRTLLASWLAEGSSKVVEHCTYTTTYTLYTARLLAKHQAKLASSVTTQQDFDVLETVWNRCDTLERWLEDALALVRTPGALKSGGNDFAVLQVSFPPCPESTQKLSIALPLAKDSCSFM